MHSKTDCLQTASVCKLYSIFGARPVWPADQTVFVSVGSGAALSVRIQIIWQLIKGGPDPGRVLQTQQIHAGVCHFHCQLGCGGRTRRPKPLEQSQRT